MALFEPRYNCYSCKKPLSSENKNDKILKKDGKSASKLILCQECLDERKEISDGVEG